VEGTGGRGCDRGPSAAGARQGSARYRTARARDEEAQLLAAGHYWDVCCIRNLLGGKVRDRVKVYTHLGLGDMRAVYESEQVDPVVERALEVVGRGYRALKAVFIPYTHFHAPLPDVDRVGQIMQGLRKAVGDDIEIMMDFHSRPASVGAPLAYIQALEPGQAVPCLSRKSYSLAMLFP
jgi:hypothetical protein